MWKIVQHIIQKQPPCKQTTSPPLGNQIGIQTNSRDCTYRVRAAPVCPEFISCHDWMWALMASDDLGPSANRPDLAKLGIAELRAHLCQGRSRILPAPPTCGQDGRRPFPAMFLWALRGAARGASPSLVLTDLTRTPREQGQEVQLKKDCAVGNCRS